MDDIKQEYTRDVNSNLQKLKEKEIENRLQQEAEKRAELERILKEMEQRMVIGGNVLP